MATYRAVISLDVERSDLIISADVDRNEVVAALQPRPAWCPFPWPEIAEPTEQDLHYLATLKFRAYLSFGAKLPDGTGQEIRGAVWQRFPSLRAALDEKVGGASLASVGLPRGAGPTARFKRFPFEATIWSGGEVSATYEHPSDGEQPPIGDIVWETLNLFIQNLVRADIEDRLAEQEGKWTPST